MFSANPRQVPGARLLQRLDYEEAQEIATTGAKVLHPRCLSPLREPRVPLLIKDTNRPELEGTVIGPEVRAHAPSVKAISARKGITLVSMESVGMWQQVGFLADVFAHFKRHGLSVDLIGSAETNVTVSLDPTENLLDSDVIAALATDLAKVCRVKVIAPCAAITLVGRGMRSLLHTLSGVLAEFGQLRVHLISQSSNNLNLTFVVDEEVVDALLPHLHELLIRAGALRTDDSAVFGPSWQMLYGGGEIVRRGAGMVARGAAIAPAGTGGRDHAALRLPPAHGAPAGARAEVAGGGRSLALRGEGEHPSGDPARARRGRLCVRMRLARRTRGGRRDRAGSGAAAVHAELRAARGLRAGAGHRAPPSRSMRCIRCSIGASCFAAARSCCASIWAAASAITTKCAPAAAAASSACRWISSPTFLHWPTTHGVQRARPARASGLGHARRGALGRGVRAAGQPGRAHRQRRVPQHRRRPRRAGASGRGAAGSRRARPAR